MGVDKKRIWLHRGIPIEKKGFSTLFMQGIIEFHIRGECMNRMLLLLEDKENSSRTLFHTLSSAGFSVLSVDLSEEKIEEYLQSTKAEAIVADGSLAMDRKSAKIMQEWRKKVEVPVVYLWTGAIPAKKNLPEGIEIFPMEENLKDRLERFLANASFQRRILRYNEIFSHVPYSLAIAGSDGRVLWANQRFCEEHALKDIKAGKVDMRNFLPEGSPAWKEIVGGTAWEGEYRAGNQQEEPRWRWIRLIPVKESSFGDGEVLWISEKITPRKDQKRLHQEQESLYATLISEMSDGVWRMDLSTNHFEMNEKWAHSLGYNRNDFGSDLEAWWDSIHPGDRERVKAEFDAHLAGYTSLVSSELRMCEKNGEYRWVLVRGIAYRDAEEEKRIITGIFTDISARRMSEEQLRNGAFSDTLTGLPNRAIFLDRLGRAHAKLKRRGNYFFAVLFLDLDEFKYVNDTLGHALGDRLLIEVSKKLFSFIRTTDTLARMGGDEFAILLDDIRDTSDAVRVAERILNGLKSAIRIDNHEMFVNVSIGIALSTSRYEYAEEFLRDADIAMYRAKSKGKSKYEIFDEKMYEQALNRFKREKELWQALEQEEFLVYYQPIILLSTETVSGFEALVRWKHPVRGIVSPAEFIPLAVEMGLITKIDRWVLKQASRLVNSWHIKFPLYSKLFLSVNLSRKNFFQENLVEEIQAILMETGLDPSTLRHEITESEMMQNLDIINVHLKKMKDLKILLHMDDFGKGYSSLSQLVNLKIDTLKIDGSFVSNMTERGENFEIVKMIVNLAHNLGMDVIAEGVETEEQLARLKRLGCEYAQGYYFARPVPGEEAERFLAEGLR